MIPDSGRGPRLAGPIANPMRLHMRSIIRRWRSAVPAAVALGLASCRTGQAPAAEPPASSAAAGAPAAATALPAAPAFDAAVGKGTRTRTGAPGPRYWQQWARYRIEAELDPAPARLTGKQTVRYFNRSPDRLDSVAVHLYQNLYASRAVRDVPGAGTKGMELSRVAAQGSELKPAAADGPAYRVEGTIAWLRMPRPIAPGDSADLEFAWQFTLPIRGTREGHDESVYFLGYWYPQVAVYDDVNGWQVDQYTGQGEFYMGYGDYDLALTVPNGWIVASTGVLRDSASVLAPQVLERLAGVRAKGGDVVNVIKAPERGTATVRAPGGKLTYRYEARNVRHTVWGTSRGFLWDVTNAVVGDRNGDGRPDTATINTFYRPEAPAWTRSARYTRHSIEFMSQLLFPYAYPHMTAIEGIEPGMEYPMVTLITAERDTTDLLETIEHEVAHMWFPMMVGSDEKRFAWMDEGLGQFVGGAGERDYLRSIGNTEAMPNRNSIREYLGFARSGREEPLMRHSDRFQDYNAYATAAYDKPVAALRALEGILGQETFLKAFREYGRRWMYRHPTPQDFFNTMSDVGGQDLTWFWRTMFYETWTLDQGIAAVRDSAEVVEIDVANNRRAAMPARVVVTRSDGSTQRLEVPVSVWLGGASRHTLKVPKTPAVTRIEIDPEEYFPDVDRRNNRWQR